MKRVFLRFLFFGGLFFPALLGAQINNIQVSAEGNDIVITYDYAVQEESIDDVIVSYTAGEETVAKEAKSISGDVRDIQPGKGKKIVWSPLNEMTSFNADNLVVYLKGIRDLGKQSQCDDNLKLANTYFDDKDYENAINYYQEMLNCASCNCNPRDIAAANEKIALANKILKAENANDGYHLAYLNDGAVADGGGAMNGASAFLLRNKGYGYYASFRSNSNYYSPQLGQSFFDVKRSLSNTTGNNSGYGTGENPNDPNFYSLNPSGQTRISSWLFSTGITKKVARYEFVSAYAFGGVGIGASSRPEEYHVAHLGHTEDRWIADGKQNLFISPEIGVIANVYDYFNVIAGIKFPLSVTSVEEKTYLNEDGSGLNVPGIKTGSLSFMFGVGLKLKTIDPKASRRNNTYFAYSFDMPTQAGPSKFNSANVIGLSTGTVSYHKIGGYISLRVNPLLLKGPEEAENGLGDNPTYSGVSDYANGFATVGLTWMYFYGGLGVSYQKEYMKYSDGGSDKWYSPSDPRIGICTEFGVNLRLFDRLLLRGGITMPGFSFKNEENTLSLNSDQMYYSLGIGYVFPLKY